VKLVPFELTKKGEGSCNMSMLEDSVAVTNEIEDERIDGNSSTGGKAVLWSVDFSHERKFCAKIIKR